MRIHAVSAREILDSRGNPTVAATVELLDGIIAEASVPSGASKGSGEEVELRDNDKSRFFGMGVLSAVSNVNTVIGPALAGMEVTSQAEIDQKMCELDGSKNKENLGANALLAVSLAVARAAAISEGLELFEYLAKIFGSPKMSLPTPMFNVLNGGKHAPNNVDIQETMIVPLGLSTFEKKLRAGAEIYHVLMKNLANKGLGTAVGDEGGFAPDLEKNELVFEYLEKAVLDAGYTTRAIRIAVDVAATSFQKGEAYFLKNNEKELKKEDYLKLLLNWAQKYNLFSIEDGLSESDLNWKKLTEEIKPTLTIGDDLFTTDPEKIELGAKEKLADGVIIKPNQIGTLSETFEAVKKAKNGKMTVIVSHRSGETEDSFIADLAVAVGADFIKAGAPARGERLAKYNRLVKIEDTISSDSGPKPVDFGQG